MLINSFYILNIIGTLLVYVGIFIKSSCYKHIGIAIVVLSLCMLFVACCRDRNSTFRHKKDILSMLMIELILLFLFLF